VATILLSLSRLGSSRRETLMLVFSAMIAAVFFVIVLIIALLVTGANLGESLGMAGFVATIALVASMILCGVDRWRWIAKRFAVRRQLASRLDTTADKFAASFPPSDRELAIHLRDRLSAFFDAPPAKIGAHDRLEQFQFARFMPGIYLFLMAEVCEKHGIEDMGAIPKSQLSTVGDLVVEAKALLREGAVKPIATADDCNPR
jgi:hypothetical protein